MPSFVISSMMIFAALSSSGVKSWETYHRGNTCSTLSSVRYEDKIAIISVHYPWRSESALLFEVLSDVARLGEYYPATLNIDGQRFIIDGYGATPGSLAVPLNQTIMDALVAGSTMSLSYMRGSEEKLLIHQFSLAGTAEAIEEMKNCAAKIEGDE